ncbi:MAG: M14 family zinc carboxypeptidase [Eubacteriales bacterium]
MYISNVVNVTKPYSYLNFLIDCANLSKKYGENISVTHTGFSEYGRRLIMIRIGTGDKKLLFTGTNHARDHITCSYLMKMCDEYLAYLDKPTYSIPFNIREILNRCRIYIIPMVNPDGLEISQNIKPNSNIVHMLRSHDIKEWKANARGVDLSMHFPCLWDELKSQPSPGFEGYKGNAPGVQREAVALMSLCRREKFDLSVSFYAKGEQIYFADALTQNKIRNAGIIARKCSQLTGYQMMPPQEDPQTYAGSFESWFRQEFEKIALSIKIAPNNSSGTPGDIAKFDDQIWPRCRYLGLLLAEQAIFL